MPDASQDPKTRKAGAEPSSAGASSSAPDHAVFMLDLAGRATQWNARVESVLGWPKAEWLGQPMERLLAPAVATSDDATALRARAERNGHADLQGLVRRPDGAVVDAIVSLSALDDDADGLRGFLAVVCDRSEVVARTNECRRLLESERQAREMAERHAAELQAAIDNIPDAVYFGDQNGITRCNENGLRMLGATSLEDLQQSMGDLAQRFQVRRSRRGGPMPSQELPFVRALRGEASVLETWATQHDTGEDVYIRGAAAPVISGGRIVGAVSVSSDLTAHRRMHEEYRRLSQVVEHSSELVAMATPHGELLYVNRAGRSMIGLEGGSAALPAAAELIHPSDSDRFDTEVVPALHANQRWAGELGLRQSGTPRALAMRWSAFAVHDDDASAEHPVVWAFIGRDMTRTKRIESALSERDQQVRALLNGVRDYAIFTVGVDGKIASWHEGAVLMKGYTVEEAVGMPFANLFTERDRAAGQPEYEMKVAAETGEYTGEGVRRRNDGTCFDAFVVFTAMRGPDGELLGYLKLTQDITQRKRQEADREELLRNTQAARAEAERANRMKNEFLATISHELRTPLGAILGWSKLLERGQHDAQGVRQGLAAISRNASIQSQLIDDLLDMGRIESGTLRLELAPVDVAMVVSAGIEATEPAAKAKEIVVRTAIDPRTPPVMADSERIQQIVCNLLNNSIKFTPRGGTVTVSTSPSPRGVEIAVSDTGQGIAPSFLPHVFDRFRQHDSSITRRQGGLGLGLSIVKQLVDLHGGSVRAESGGEGQGATFRIELPASASLPEWSGPPLRAKGFVFQRPTGTGRPLHGVKVLIVDDETDARQVAREVLERAGATVVEADNAIAALDVVKRDRPDVMLSDIGMPQHDGYELISWVRALHEHDGGRVPAAAVTAYASGEDRDRALRSGFQAHVAKPVDVDVWVATVQRLADRRVARTG